MIYAEVFAGAGGMSLGLLRAGMKCAWHAENAPRANRVLAARFPNTPLVGDVTDLRGAGLRKLYGQLDLLSGGSPCQGMSIAGKRKGLMDDRSILFYEQMRLWDETEAPLCLWENVIGALSSNQGRDFARVLSAFCGGRITVPRHPKSRKRIPWARSGMCIGSTGVAAWRVLDAQFFGVPQKRRRVFVLGSRTGRYDPAKILLEPESMYGDSESRISPREKDSRDAGNGASGSSRETLAFHHKQDPDAHPVSPPLGTTAMGMGVVNRLVAFGEYKEDEVSSAIQSRDYKYVTDIVVQPVTFKPSHFTRGKDGAPNTIVPPLSADADRGDQESVVVVPQAINVSDSAPSLDTVSSALQARESAGGIGCGAQMQAVLVGAPRRFMPIECERLMGWPDNHTLVGEGKERTDTPRYILCGNGCVADQAEWIGRRILGRSPNSELLDPRYIGVLT